MIEATEPFAMFAEAILPSDLPDALYMHLGAIAEQCELAAHEVQTHSGDAEKLIFIAQGSAKLVAKGAGEREQIIGFHFAGDFLRLPCPCEHSYTLVALEDAQLLVFSASQFVELARGEPGILQHLLDQSATMLDRSREKSIVLGRKNACERMASFLLSMARRIGEEQADTIRLTLPMSRREIGESLGLTIETVSRQLTLLRDAQIIETHGRNQVILRHPEELQKRSGWLTRAN
ncbi:Crp/Fnr family transcriptional regulator [Aurantiacibacter sediminis]|uniref:Crp/Fnr family transcriptional regulator n=2 Tax=Aurantiacibacter sediminis TaxID=2793064 RepID=A0ABS0N1D9_9SPHN|nr:Crp/Fnr family transcriptional regulator [Aurantiacibacter sediminis]